MKLKPDIDYAAFIRAVDLCEKDVTFETPEGDVLNLKSALSKYIFLSGAAMKALVERGYIVMDPADVEKIQDYLMEG